VYIHSTGAQQSRVQPISMIGCEHYYPLITTA